jgi:hypothetical protein
MLSKLVSLLENTLIRTAVFIRNSLLLQVIRDLMRVLQPIRFVCFMLVIGGFALLTFEQLSEILKIMVSEEFWTARIVFLLAFSGWAYASWFSARFSLDACCLYENLLNRRGNSISQIVKTHSHRRVVFFMAFIPRLLGLLCHVIILIAFIQIEPLGKEVGLYAALTVIYLVFVFFHRETVHIRQGTFSYKNLFRYSYLSQRFDPCKIHNWQHLTVAERRLVRTALWLSGSIFLLFVCTPRSWQLAFYERTTLVASDYSAMHFLNALILMLLSLFVWLTLGMYLQQLAQRMRIRLFTTLLVFAILFSFSNNNHLVRTQESSAVRVAQRPSLSAYVENWYAVKYQQWQKDSMYSDSLPVFIIAAEGGGSRAAYWTGMALQKLYQQYPEAYPYTFAISSVSGGSLGAAMYLSFRRDLVDQRDTLTLKRMVSKDFLTSVTSALLYPELVQKVLPFPVTAFDRARWLEDSWARVYETTLHRNTWNDSFLSLWQSSDYTLPLLFVNSTKVETGQKILVSSVRTDTTFLKDAIDLLDVSGRDLPLKTAISLSARFPLVTPGGRIRSYWMDANSAEKDSVWGHAVDGGYFENTGLGTATELYLFLHQIALDKQLKIRPVLISIVNDDYSPNDNVFRNRLMYELQTPLSAFYNAWGRRSPGTNFIARKLISEDNFLNIALNRQTADVPLNWYISPMSVKKMQAQLDRYDFSKMARWLR